MTIVVNIANCRDFDPKTNPDDIYIGRFHTGEHGFYPKSEWHNPYQEADFGREQAVELYRKYIVKRPELMARLSELKGKRLGCWCKPLPCHGDVLVRLVDEYA